ncbi:hypothetical protein CEUSTIGMA_g6381.t1 [Chlamydomonas eustigma]|uniref:FIST C-domain domain-containing protein n=1 Tax=Chlamydomonas eustigma TaxID=1157962 RepID=A0A250X782_9CHLO|nr:hypothetical protein CEUSTIGMA_g6381.t1 [Chlamydomonas eustigma]|eukprot:GAX78941.1 hypothetical protein CEUSTIGMA_g6381.t1 [Chlamydomonas eustigma]
MDEVFPLQDLHDDIILRILAGTGSKAIVQSSSCSKRLKSIKEALGQHSCFSSAASEHQQLEEAICDAAKRALEGMLGTVSFAVIFIANYPHPKKYRDPGDVSNAAEMLSRHLPPGTSIVGCAVAGLMGFNEAGEPFEIDPQEDHNRRGVTILLGHMPNAVVRVFADTPDLSNKLSESDVKTGGRRRRSSAGSHHSSSSQIPPWKAIEEWVGFDREGQPGLVPVSAWVMVQNNERCNECMWGEDGLIPWIMSKAPPDQPPAVAGGLSSGRGSNLLFYPSAATAIPPQKRRKSLQITSDAPIIVQGRSSEGNAVRRNSQREEEMHHPQHDTSEMWTASGWDPLAGVQKARFVGLMICKALDAQPSDQPVDDGCMEISLQATVSQDVPHVKIMDKAAVIPNRVSTPSPKAAIMSMRGAGPVPLASWWTGVRRLDRAFTPRGTHTMILPDISKFRRLGRGDVIKLMHQVESKEGNGTTSTTASTAEDEPDFLAEMQLLMERQWSDYMLGLWRCDATPDCMRTGLTAEVLRSGLAVVCNMQLIRLRDGSDDNAALMLQMDDEDVGTADKIFAKGSEQVCCQLMDVTPESIQALLGSQLPILHRHVSRDILTRKSEAIRPWDGYSLLRKGAETSGVRCGPAAITVFSCNGRGASIFSDSHLNEAKITDTVFQKQVPFIGAYCGGEIGPRVRYGYVGWASPWLPSRDEGPQREALSCTSDVIRRPAGMETTSDKAGDSQEDALGNDPCKAQGWTSMYAACG